MMADLFFFGKYNGRSVENLERKPAYNERDASTSTWFVGKKSGGLKAGVAEG